MLKFLSISSQSASLNLIIATFFFALMEVLVKLLTRIPFYEIVFFRGFIALVICYFMLRRLDISVWGTHKKLLIFRGLTGTIALTCFFYTLKAMPLATAVVLQHLAPIFTILIAGIVVKEPPKIGQVIFFIVSFSGIIIIKGFDPNLSSFDLMIGLVSAFFSAIAYNTIRMMNGKEHPLVIVFYFPLIVVPIIGSYTVFHWTQPTTWEWTLLLLVGISTQIAQVYMTKAFQAARAANVAYLSYISIIFAIIFGYSLFDEALNHQMFIGIGLITFGAIAATFYRQKSAINSIN